MRSDHCRKNLRFAAGLLALLLAAGVCGSFSSCSRAPGAEALRGEVEALVEASYEINAIFYGAGLPVLDRTSELYADFYTYYAPTITRDYDIVSPHARYTRIAELKAAAERVYSPSWCESVLYVSAFVGVTSDLGADLLVSDPIFVEDENYLYQSVARIDYLSRGEKIYDYSTMRVVRPSNATAVSLRLTAWYVSSPDEPFTASLRLILTDNGWRLDSPTY